MDDRILQYSNTAYLTRRRGIAYQMMRMLCLPKINQLEPTMQNGIYRIKIKEETRRKGIDAPGPSS